MNEEIDKLRNVMYTDFEYIHTILENKELDMSDDFKKINHTYFHIFCTHYESFFILMNSRHFSSAILLLRTMLELYVKSYYLELIEKEKNTNIIEFIDERKKFPSFFAMIDKLEKHNSSSGAKFNGDFSQFTKSGLASYEKFSLFSHGRGIYVKAIFEGQKFPFSNQNIIDVYKTAKGLFETLSLLLMLVQGFDVELKQIASKLHNKTE